MTFIHSHRVRYHETDAQSFLFNSRYLEIADVALTEFLRHLGFDYAGLAHTYDTDPSVVSAQLTFTRPARFDEVLDFRVACVRVGRSSFELAHTVMAGDAQVAAINIVYVNVDTELAASRPLHPAVADALTRYRSAT
ncbi:acyl-CoA thioesterase [Streptomyces sp. GMR22]|uniref:acyl-CoA thioesterase n=1 Tax=Streptomyces sp. GMR22 TaxID=2759524 RepID=UPI0015FD79E5|nr:thioesterase family protein [Streptomyces sp. GMR22]MBA6440765.1 acyl-CoA thioesterase [Streptomyces sp. GMR22]